MLHQRVRHARWWPAPEVHHDQQQVLRQRTLGLSAPAFRIKLCLSYGKSVLFGRRVNHDEPVWSAVGAPNVTEDFDYMVANGFESELCEAWEERERRDALQ